MNSTHNYLRYALMLLTTACLLPHFLHGQTTSGEVHRLLREGDRLYREKAYEQAAERYKTAEDKQSSTQGSYNLGNTYYQQGDYARAARQFEQAAEAASRAEDKARAYYNLGNSYYQQQQLDKSIEAYKQSLRLQPGDAQAKNNLAVALREQQQQQQQQQQNSSQASRQEEEQPSSSTGGEGEQQASSGEQPREQPPSGRGGDVAEGTLSKDEAEQLLRIAEEEEQKTRQKLRRSKAGSCGTDKAW
jgi:Ca-activated chloride channel family protein